MTAIISCDRLTHRINDQFCLRHKVEDGGTLDATNPAHAWNYLVEALDPSDIGSPLVDPSATTEQETE